MSNPFRYALLLLYVLSTGPVGAEEPEYLFYFGQEDKQAFVVASAWNTGKAPMRAELGRFRGQPPHGLISENRERLAVLFCQRDSRRKIVRVFSLPVLEAMSDIELGKCAKASQPSLFQITGNTLLVTETSGKESELQAIDLMNLDNASPQEHVFGHRRKQRSAGNFL